MMESIQDVLDWTRSAPLQGQNGEIAGYLASGLVFAAFIMKSMVPLRSAAILSNVALIIYAAVEDMWLLLILHSVLLPLNVVRLLQYRAERARQPVAAILRNDLCDRAPRADASGATPNAAKPDQYSRFSRLPASSDSSGRRGR